VKIQQLLSGISVPVTNEEQKFINRHHISTTLTSLDEHDHWIAQSLVRKGVYVVGRDNNTLIKTINEDN